MSTSGPFWDNINDGTLNVALTDKSKEVTVAARALTALFYRSSSATQEGCKPDCLTVILQARSAATRVVPSSQHCLGRFAIVLRLPP